MNKIDIIFIIGVLTGGYAYHLFLFFKEYIKLEKIKKEYKSVFNEIKNAIGTQSMKFINRINYSVVFKVETTKFGTFDVVIFLDKNEINLIRDQKLLYSSNNNTINKNFIENIIIDITITYKEINDVVNIAGTKIDRKTINQMTKKLGFELIDVETESPTRVTSNEINLDDVLDKINVVGLEGLTKEELDFLNKQSK